MLRRIFKSLGRSAADPAGDAPAPAADAERPDVLAALPDARFAFVHIDVDLYRPTLACLEHFWPRLAEGGAIVCDDYGAPRFPGAARAWDEYCERHRIPFVVLDTGQSVILRE